MSERLLWPRMLLDHWTVFPVESRKARRDRRFLVFRLLQSEHGNRRAKLSSLLPATPVGSASPCFLWQERELRCDRREHRTTPSCHRPRIDFSQAIHIPNAFCLGGKSRQFPLLRGQVCRFPCNAQERWLAASLLFCTAFLASGRCSFLECPWR